MQVEPKLAALGRLMSGRDVVSMHYQSKSVSNILNNIVGIMRNINSVLLFVVQPEL